jgi:hypothetical protein
MPPSDIRLRKAPGPVPGAGGQKPKHRNSVLSLPSIESTIGGGYDTWASSREEIAQVAKVFGTRRLAVTAETASRASAMARPKTATSKIPCQVGAGNSITVK